ncbi:MAG: carboxypeptidase regulatory-like domain-containing protein [Euryarchaeota archaeon]|nr:carboxypeptidase regulatory-like domain-containing protein [Euryarchaeota archaeon]
MRSAFLVAGLLVAASWAGCVSDEGEPKSSSSPTTEAPPPTVTVETGSLAGTVTDDEGLPLPGAEVVIAQPAREAETDAGGAFTFNELDPGTYTVVAQKLGFESNAKKVEVRAGEVTNATFQLAPVVFANESYTLTIPKVAMFHYGFRVANFVFSVVNQSAINQYMCDPCLFVLHFPVKPQQAMTETYWTATFPVPMTNADTYIFYKSSWTTGAYLDGTQVYANQFENRESVKWATAGVASLGKVLLHANPSYFGSFEHKVDIYTSFAYGAEFDDDFTMLPPP